MQRALFLVLMGSLAAGLLMAIGCSNEDNPTDAQQVAGDTSTVSFKVAQDLIGDESDLFDVGGDINLSFALFNAATGSYPISKSTPRGANLANLAVTDDSIYNIVVGSWEFTADKWFVCSFSASQTTIDCDGETCDTTMFSFEGIDSLQILLATVALDTSEYGGDIDQLKTREHASASGSSDLGNFDAAVHRRLDAIRGALSNDSLVEVNAGEIDTLTIYVVGDSGSCELTLTETSSVDGLVVSGDETAPGECPRAGGASKNSTINLACIGTDELQNLKIEGAWNVTAAVQTNGSVLVKYVNGNTLWQIAVAAGNCF